MLCDMETDLQHCVLPTSKKIEHVCSFGCEGVLAEENTVSSSHAPILVVFIQRGYVLRLKQIPFTLTLTFVTEAMMGRR